MTTPPLTRQSLLLAQFDTSYEYLVERLKGLGDEEYNWEPAPNSWGVRRREHAATAHALGGGEWVLDHERGTPDPPPVATIAWRICHIVQGQQMRHDYTFGTKSLQEDTLILPGNVAEAMEWMRRTHAAWRTGLAGLSESDLDIVGLSTYPWGLDPRLPFGAIWWWTNRELIHHGAEIGLLRDLWANRGP
jgi:hypothetical protein